MRIIRADNLIVADDDRGKSMNAEIAQSYLGSGTATPRSLRGRRVCLQGHAGRAEGHQGRHELAMIISKKPPYLNTKADPERTQSQINKLLQKYGVSSYAWTTEWDKAKVQLALRIEQDNKGARKVYDIVMEPPTFAKSHRTYIPMKGRSEVVYAPNWAASFRFLYYHVKAKLEEVAYGGSTVEKAFMAEILTRLPDGSTKTIYQVLADRQAFEKGLFLEDKGEAKEVQATSGPKVTDATYTEASEQ